MPGPVTEAASGWLQLPLGFGVALEGLCTEKPKEPHTMAVKASIRAGENQAAGSFLLTVESSLGCARELLREHLALSNCGFSKGYMNERCN